MFQVNTFVTEVMIDHAQQPIDGLSLEKVKRSETGKPSGGKELACRLIEAVIVVKFNVLVFGQKIEV